MRSSLQQSEQVDKVVNTFAHCSVSNTRIHRAAQSCSRLLIMHFRNANMHFARSRLSLCDNCSADLLLMKIHPGFYKNTSGRCSMAFEVFILYINAFQCMGAFSEFVCICRDKREAWTHRKYVRAESRMYVLPYCVWSYEVYISHIKVNAGVKWLSLYTAAGTQYLAVAFIRVPCYYYFSLTCQCDQIALNLKS